MPVKKRIKILLTVCFVLPCLLMAQVKHSNLYNKEIAFTTENDAFLLNQGDAYYTNGFFLRYTQAGERNGIKLTHSLEAGQMIFTPLIRLTTKATDIDRPYSGYLFVKYNRASFARNSGILQYGATAGIVGPSSFGKDVQDWYHNMLGYGRFRGWGYQVTDAVGLDLHLSYARTLLQDSAWIKLVPVAEVKLGSNFTNATLGMVTFMGNFNENGSSMFWNARVQQKSDARPARTEFFVYWYPQVILQGYNATVEGGLFSKTDTAVLGMSSRWMFQQSFGACLAKGRWSTRVAVVLQTREAVKQTKPQRYGSIQVGYRIR